MSHNSRKPVLLIILSRIFVAGWLCLTFIALIFMFHLWWSREQALYCGKTSQEQRVMVFRRAGLSENLVPALARIDQHWPRHIHYCASGDANQLSYATYLLAPRVPSGDENLQLFIGQRDDVPHGAYVWSPEQNDGVVAATSGKLSFGLKSDGSMESWPKALGLLLSFSFILGLGRLAGQWPFSKFPISNFQSHITFPERLGLGAIFLSAVVMLSKLVVHDARPGMLLAAAIGICGLSVLVCHILCGQRSRSGWQPLGRASPTKSGHFDICRARMPVGLRAEIRSAGVWVAKAARKVNILGWADPLWRKSLTPTFIAIIVLGFVWSMCMAIVVVPDDWDSWATWGGKAKVLAVGEGTLRDVTHFGFSDYPLLWPSIWAFSGWCSGGGWEEHWSRGWGPVFMLLTALQMLSIVRDRTKNPSLGVFAGALFVSVPAVPLIASWSYAEAPMWLMTICAFGRFLRWRDSGKLQDLALCGLFAAGVGLTKNEGVLFIIALLLAIILTRILSGRTVFIRPLAAYLVPVIVLYGPWALWTRAYLGLESHATRCLVFQTESISRMYSRFPVAVSTVFRIWCDFRQWNVVVALAFVLVVWLLIKGPARLRIELLVPVICILGPFIILLFHETEIAWAVGASWNRFTAAVLPFLLVTTVPILGRHVFVARY